MNNEPNRSEIKFSPSELKIVQLLSDGLPHTKKEIRDALIEVERVRSRHASGATTDESIQVLLSKIRQRFRVLGPVTISLVPDAISINGTVCWQLVKCLPATGKDVEQYYRVLIQ